MAHRRTPRLAALALSALMIPPWFAATPAAADPTAIDVTIAGDLKEVPAGEPVNAQATVEDTDTDPDMVRFAVLDSAGKPIAGAALGPPVAALANVPGTNIYGLVGTEGTLLVYPPDQAPPGLKMVPDGSTAVAAAASAMDLVVATADGKVYRPGDETGPQPAGDFGDQLTPGATITGIAARTTDPEDPQFLLVDSAGQIIQSDPADFEDVFTDEGKDSWTELAPGSPPKGKVAGITFNTEFDGLWLFDEQGTVIGVGHAAAFDRNQDSPGDDLTGKQVVDLATNHDGTGYWLVARDGAVAAHGEAGHFGSLTAAAAPVLGAATTRTGMGYWVATADGFVESFGDAPDLGSLYDIPTDGGTAVFPFSVRKAGPVTVKASVLGPPGTVQSNQAGDPPLTDTASIMVTPAEPAKIALTGPTTAPTRVEQSFTATVTDQFDNRVADGVDVVFTAEGPGSPKSATVKTSAGAANFKITSTEPGTTNVTAKVGEIGSTPIDLVWSARAGYWMLGADGKIYEFGDAKKYGEPASGIDIERTPSGNGYWVLQTGGKVRNFGDAVDHGSPAVPSGEKAVSISSTPAGDGYWIFTDKGRAMPAGKAAAGLGDLISLKLNKAVLDSVSTPTGNGYYMVAEDGGVFAFGDAAFKGSMGGKPLNGPVQSLVPDGDNVGYWLVATDGGIFSFEADFKGSMGATRLNKPVTGMVRYGKGYLMVAEDGGIFDFSGDPNGFKGSLGATPPANPVVAVAGLD
jgi:hypothetical protein